MSEHIYFQYLDDLRESGVTNMFGAGAYLRRDFDLDAREAKEIVLAWLSSFHVRHLPKDAGA